MSSVISSLRALRRDQAGVAAMEFGLIAIPLFFIMIAITDLGRYFLTQHSLRTMTAEAIRSMMVNTVCFDSGTCSLSATQISAVEAQTPFLIAGSTNLSGNQTLNATTGKRTASVTAVYPFTFIFYQWAGNSGNITETATVTY